MAALAAAVRPFAGGVPRRAAPAPSDASVRASGKKPRRVVAPARDTSVCHAGVDELYVPSQKRKMTCNRINVETAAADTKVLTAAGEMSARELLHKRLACELDVLSGLLKKAELISRRGACKDGAPTAGKKERFLASKQRPEPMEDGGTGGQCAFGEEEEDFNSGGAEAEAGHIFEFLLKHFGDADTRGEIEIDFDSAEDSVLFELKTQLDKFAQERPIVVDVLPEEKDEKLAEESKSKGILVQQEEEDVHICGVSTIVQTGSRPSSRSSSDPDTGSYSDRKSDSDDFPALWGALPEQIIVTSAQPPSEPASGAAQSGEAKKVQDVHRAAPKTVSLAGLIYRAKVRRELLEMERAVLPDESIHPRDLQRLGIAEYGRPSIMRQLGLFLKADDA
ncbi:unnamed protein product [Miscanthus lutarioriparius]|uniref:Uncharacterized protein n=1 Tax=Miscanthus lutarioriparius TaxID=422564 RepID=A0A811PZQ2_9POAL|nr:unnamed protein product [Miscanthus lutarioriparius]